MVIRKRHAQHRGRKNDCGWHVESKYFLASPTGRAAESTERAKAYLKVNRLYLRRHIIAYPDLANTLVKRASDRDRAGTASDTIDWAV